MPGLPQFIEEDIQQLDNALRDLLAKSEASVALIIDKGGFLIAQQGALQGFDTTTLAALAAGSFAATQGMAGLVSEPNFNSIYQQGDSYSLLVQNIDENCLLVVIFKAKTSVGAVKYFSAATLAQVATRIHHAQLRDPNARLDLSLLNVAETQGLFRKHRA